MNRLRLIEQRDPILEIRPGLEKAIAERDRQRAIVLLRNFIPLRYRWLFYELVKRSDG